MKLDGAKALLMAGGSDHGVLCTLHPERGVDAVPAVFAMLEHPWVGVPVDRVKAKASTALQRVRNLETDPRATLLVEQWNRTDWSQLWWVRVGLTYVSTPPAEVTVQLANALEEKYAQYAGHRTPGALMRAHGFSLPPGRPRGHG